jgi:response regulator RpfG family c-di-GMP phosphodiesterase
LEDDAHSPAHIVTRSGLGYLMPPIEEWKRRREEAVLIGKSIFIVDKKTVSSTFLTSFLKGKLFKVLEAPTGKERQIVAWHDAPDLILFDPMLEDIPDKEFIQIRTTML